MHLARGIVLLLLIAVSTSSHAASTGAPIDALFDAIRTNDLSAVTKVIDAGVAVDTRDAGGMTPLLHASIAGQVGMVRLLLARHADPAAQDTQRYDAMDYAMERHRYEVALLLLEGQAKRLSSTDAEHVLIEAVAAGRPLAERGAVSAALATPLLLIAAARGDGANVAWLLARGAQVDGNSEQGYTALAMAARWNRDSVVTQLLAAGADPNRNTRSRYSTTALMEASRDGRVAIARQLIAAGADVNRPDRHGDHALNWAAYFGHADFVALMVEHGADLERTGQTDDQPIEIALRERHAEVVRILTEAGAVARAGKQPP